MYWIALAAFLGTVLAPLILGDRVVGDALPVLAAALVVWAAASALMAVVLRAIAQRDTLARTLRAARREATILETDLRSAYAHMGEVNRVLEILTAAVQRLARAHRPLCALAQSLGEVLHAPVVVAQLTHGGVVCATCGSDGAAAAAPQCARVLRRAVRANGRVVRHRHREHVLFAVRADLPATILLVAVPHDAPALERAEALLRLLLAAVAHHRRVVTCYNAEEKR